MLWMQMELGQPQNVPGHSDFADLLQPLAREPQGQESVLIAKCRMRGLCTC